MPGDGSVPTSRWKVDDRIDDYYSLQLPPDLPPGDYRLVVGLYDLASGRRLVAEGAPPPGNEVEVGKVQVGA
jgi:hypothetical protein